MVVGYGTAQLVRFGSNLVLTRLLFPRAFGLMLLVNVFLQGLQLFSDLGIGPSIVQNKRSDAGFLNTAWTLQVGRGAVLWLATWVVAWPASLLYGEPQLLWMIPIAGIAAAVDGTVSTAIHSAYRELRVGQLQLFDVSIQITASVVMIVAAWVTRSVWALVAGMVAASVVRSVLSHTLLPGVRNRLHWDREAAKGLLHFGLWVFTSSALTFLAQQGDRLVFGKMLTLARLGVYNVALSLVEAPSALVSAISFRVFFPMFAEVRRTGPDLNTAYRKASAGMSLLAGAGALCALVAGPLLVRFLYDARYAEAGRILRLLAFGIWGSSLVHFTAAVVMAGGRVKTLAAANGARLLWLAATVPAAFHLSGLEVAIAFVVLADVPRYVVLGLGCRRDGVHIFRADARRTATFLAAAAAGLLFVRVAGSDGPLSVGIGCAVALGAWSLGNLDAARWYVAKARSLGARRGSTGPQAIG